MAFRGVSAPISGSAVHQWFGLSSAPADLDTRLEEVGARRLATAVLMVFVDCCKQLPLTKGPLMSGKPDPSVQVL